MPSLKPVSILSASVFVIGQPLFAADIGGDLKATIALQGSPCDQIVQQSRNGDSDYNVSCRDGNQYHVYVNGQGRVVVQKINQGA